MESLPPIPGSANGHGPIASQPVPIVHDAFKPGPVSLPGVNIRNPVTGRSRIYSHYPWSKSSSFSKVSPHHMREHERSIFTHTTYGHGYFIIAPDWASEGVGRRRIVAKERNHTSWNSRPAVQPLPEFIIPLLERRASRAGFSVEEMYNNLSTQRCGME